MFKHDETVHLIYGLSLLLTLGMFPVIILVPGFHFISLSCNSQIGLIIASFDGFPLVFVLLISRGIELYIWILESANKKLQKRKDIFRIKTIKEIFEKSFSSEKYVTRLILEYYGEIEQEELDRFALVRMRDISGVSEIEESVNSANENGILIEMEQVEN
jgi:hypothetical protein